MTDASKKMVLVVDDEEEITFYLQTLLEDEGINVVTASNGLEAMEQVKKHKPDFISLDLIMPKKSGIKFYYELRKNKEWSKIPVIIVTAHAHDEFGKTDIKDLVEGKVISGPLTYLEKPVSPQKYVNTVKRILGLPETETVIEKKSKDELQKELQKMLDSADKSKLQEALNLLKKKN